MQPNWRALLNSPCFVFSMLGLIVAALQLAGIWAPMSVMGKILTAAAHVLLQLSAWFPGMKLSLIPGAAQAEVKRVSLNPPPPPAVSSGK